MTEMVGSGPFRYIAAERVAGATNVYQRFDKYVPRPEGKPSFTAGPRVAHFDRVEWVTMPDPATQSAALQAGEVDWVEQPVMDLVPQLKKNPAIKVQVVESSGLIGVLRFNFLYPPFDNAAIRRVVLRAVNQRDFMEAVTGDNTTFDAKVGAFGPGMPMDNDAGMAAFATPADPAQLKKDLIAAGYKGERVVYLTATDVSRTNAICEVGAQMLRNIGMNVDEISTDWGHRGAALDQPEADRPGWLEHVRLVLGRVGHDESGRRAATARQRRQCLERLADLPEAGGAAADMAGSDRPGAAKGDRPGHPVAGMAGRAVPACGPVHAADGLPRQPDGHAGRVAAVYERTPGLGTSQRGSEPL